MEQSSVFLFHEYNHFIFLIYRNIIKIKLNSITNEMYDIKKTKSLFYYYSEIFKF